MFSIKACPVPDQALLRKYVQTGTYTDCYRTEIQREVTLAEFVRAFYTTWIFKLERAILNWAVAKPSSDDQASRLADGSIDHFAAWQVENRSENQLLMTDFQGRTRSWFMTLPADAENSARTVLYFGSAVTSVPASETGEMTPGRGYSALLEFHKIYSRVLLYSARSRLTRQLP